MMLVEIVNTSGWIGWLIFIVFGLGMFLVVERWLAYFRATSDMRAFQQRFDDWAGHQQWAEIRSACMNAVGDLKELGAMVVEHGYRGPATLRSVLNNHVDAVILPRLRARLRELAMLAKIAPMLGLFGTVYGMIEAFGKIAGAQGQGVDPKEMADSIGIALGTTFLGLMAAMPIIVFLSILQSKIEAFTIALEQFTERSVYHVANATKPLPKK